MNRWNEKRLQTQAEVLFELACVARGYKPSQLPVLKIKTPDFRVEAGTIEFVAEVKSPGLDKQILEGMAGGQNSFCFTPGKRVRDFIKDSAAQLAAVDARVPRVLVICDLRPFLATYPMYPFCQFGPGDIADGMFGETQYIFEKRPEGLVPKGPRLGGKRTLKADHYTHLSALALLLWKDVDQPAGVEVYHNPFAEVCLPTGIFAGNDDHHHRLVEQEGQLFKQWEPCDALRS
jgi:hypothetical protein